jgi:hypothetical protein
MREIAQPLDSLQCSLAGGVEQLHAAAGAFDDQAKVSAAAQFLRRRHLDQCEKGNAHSKP